MDRPVTVLAARERQAKIGPGEPFVIIGERINPTNRAKLSGSMETHDMSVVKQDALEQVRAGAQVLDVNVGTCFGVETEIMPLAVKAILEVIDVPLCIDSKNPDAIAVGLETYQKICGPKAKALINSTTAEEESLKAILPLAQKYGAAVIGLPYDEQGIPVSQEERFEFAEIILAKAKELGIPHEDVIIDGITLTVGSDHTTAWTAMTVTERISKELGINTTSGASNVSFGLPGRKELNVTYLAMMIAKGLTCAITNPLKEEIFKTVQAANLFMKNDPYGLNWIKVNK